MAEPTIERNENASRYELWSDGKVVSIADFVDTGTEVVFTHTETEDEFRGHGLAEVLVVGALQDVEEAGKTAVSKCWFVSEVMERLRNAS